VVFTVQLDGYCSSESLSLTETVSKDNLDFFLGRLLQQILDSLSIMIGDFFEPFTPELFSTCVEEDGGFTVLDGCSFESFANYKLQ